MTVETVSTEEQLDQAIIKLGTLQERAGQRRVYFDDLMGWLQLEIERDESGNILAATRGGQPIANSNAVRIENQIRRAKLYYDLDERVFRGQGLDSINRGDLAKAITLQAEEILAAAHDEESLDGPDESDGASDPA